MRRITLSCVAIAVAFSSSSIALCQTDPIDALLKQESLASVPTDCQTDVQPGSYIALLKDGSTTCGRPGALGHAFDLTFPETLPIATVAGLTIDVKKGGSLLAKILGYQVGGALTSQSTLTSDQAIFSVAKLDDDQLNAIVLNDPATKNFFDTYAGTRGALVYIVQTVYRTKALNITAGDAKGAALANGKAATSCTVTDPTPKEKATNATNDNAAAAAEDVAKAAAANAPSASTPGTPQAGNKTHSMIVKESAAAGLAKLSTALTAAAANAATSAAASAATPVSVSGDVCKTVGGTYLLLSSSDVVVGLKVAKVNNFRDHVPLGHVNHNPWIMNWTPSPQPLLK